MATDSAGAASPSNAQETLARWLAEEDAVRERISKIGVAPVEQVAHLSGMEMLQAMLRGELPRPPISRTLDFTLLHVEPGMAIFQGRPGLAHYNPLGTVHGGWFATLLDSAMGCAVQTTVPAGRAYTTMELKVNLVRALFAEVGAVRAEGHVIHAGRQSATAEARLVGPDGKLYAHGTTTCLIFDR